MTKDRFLQKIRFQLLGAYQQSSLWLGHFYLLITVFRLAAPHHPMGGALALESLVACLCFYAIARFTRLLAQLLGGLENIAVLMFSLILANNTILAAVVRDPKTISLFILTMIMAGAGLRSRFRFALVEALCVGLWGLSCRLWLPGSWFDNFDLFLVLSGALAGGILFGFIRNLVGTLSRLREKDHQLLTQRTALVRDLQDALASVRTLRGIIPICSYCHKVRNDEGYWNQVETYLAANSDARFSHGICPTCMEPFATEMAAMKAAEGLTFDEP